MYEDILVTVITCVYNTPIEYLKDAVKSILNQTHQNFEYYIVDDCSKFDLYQDDVFLDSRIHIIRLTKNSGAAIARNVALSKAHGKYIAIMDSDDISLPQRFEKQIIYMEQNSDVAVCGTWFRYFEEKNHDVKYIIDDNEYYRCCLLFDNYPTILNPSAMIRRSVLIDNNIKYDERLRKAQDYGMWVAISKYGKCTNYKEILVNYRWHKNQITQRLYTYDVNPYNWIIISDQLEKLGVELNEDEVEVLKLNFMKKEVEPYIYWQILNKILSANQKSKIYIQDKLKKRVEEQWRQKIYNTSLFEIFRLMKKLPFCERRKILRMEFERFLMKVGMRSKNTLQC